MSFSIIEYAEIEFDIIFLFYDIYIEKVAKRYNLINQKSFLNIFLFIVEFDIKLFINYCCFFELN